MDVYHIILLDLRVWLQRAQAAEAETREILMHSQQQQAISDQMDTERLSRQLSKGAFEAVQQDSISGDTDSSMQLLAQVPPMTCTM